LSTVENLKILGDVIPSCNTFTPNFANINQLIQILLEERMHRSQVCNSIKQGKYKKSGGGAR